jgi:hypothetical protein
MGLDYRVWCAFRCGWEMGEALMGESREGITMIYQMEWAPCEGIELVA